jgi:hypothetical protein
MPYAPATEPLESYCVIEGQRCSPQKAQSRTASILRQGQRLHDRKMFHDALAQKVQALRNTGAGYKEIAYQMGMTHDAIYRALRRPK